MMDAYTNVFSSPGKRTTGTAASNFLVTGPSFKDIVPEGIDRIDAQTDMVWILGRPQVNNAEDGKGIVYPMQDGFKLTPLSSWGLRNYNPGLLLNTKTHKDSKGFYPNCHT